MVIGFKKIRGSDKSAHQQVQVNGLVLGEVWREQVWTRTDGQTGQLWRWFAKAPGITGVLGHGARYPVMNGAGFVSKEKAAEMLFDVRAGVLLESCGQH